MFATASPQAASAPPAAVVDGQMLPPPARPRRGGQQPSTGLLCAPEPLLALVAFSGQLQPSQTMSGSQPVLVPTGQGAAQASGANLRKRSRKQVLEPGPSGLVPPSLPVPGARKSARLSVAEVSGAASILTDMSAGLGGVGRSENEAETVLRARQGRSHSQSQSESDFGGRRGQGHKTHNSNTAAREKPVQATTLQAPDAAKPLWIRGKGVWRLARMLAWGGVTTLLGLLKC